MLKTKYKKLQELLDKAILAEKADKGNIQIYYAESADLRIVAQSGFEESFLKHFLSVKPFDSSTCGRAFGVSTTVLINDINIDPGYKANRNAAKQAGYRAVKSVPIFGKNKKCIGIISTHFKEPKWHWDTHDITNILPQIAIELEEVLNSAIKA